MKKSLGWVFLLAIAVIAMASPALAEEAAHTASSGGGNMFYTVVILTASVTMVIAAVGVGWAQSSAIKAAVEGIARNPGSAGKILTTMLIGLAMMESLAIYVLVIAFILLFANPLLQYIG
jgi:F-type H+-transporting ATPase subunit c